MKTLNALASWVSKKKVDVGAIWERARAAGAVPRGVRAVAVLSEDVPVLLGLVELLTDALLDAEWSSNHGGDPCTACCEMGEDEDREVHRKDCSLDLALNVLGLDTQAKRDERRRAIRLRRG